MSRTASRLYRLPLLVLLLLSIAWHADSVTAQVDNEAAEACWPDEEADDSAGYAQWENPPELVIDEDQEYAATIETDAGDIELQLFASEAPIAVNNFVCLALAGYYDDTSFHRVVPGFVIQGGDPTGTSSGGPGYEFEDEPVERDYEEGTLAMANAGPDTNGSQFFIVLDDQSGASLPPDYTIFGEVTDGRDVVQEIGEEEVEPGSGDGIDVNTIVIDGPIAAQDPSDEESGDRETGNDDSDDDEDTGPDGDSLVIGQILVATSETELHSFPASDSLSVEPLDRGEEMVVRGLPVADIAFEPEPGVFFVYVILRESERTGYVIVDNVEITDRGDPTTSGAQVETLDDTDLRSAPTEDGVLVDELDEGTDLAVIGQPEDGDRITWSLVQDDETGNVGYVDAADLTVEGLEPE